MTAREQRTTAAPEPLSIHRSFVVELRGESRGDRISGRVEHVISGRAVQFGSARELLDFFDRVTAGERSGG